jgi:hypothetical protein
MTRDDAQELAASLITAAAEHRDVLGDLERLLGFQREAPDRRRGEPGRAAEGGTLPFEDYDELTAVQITRGSDD